VLEVLLRTTWAPARHQTDRLRLARDGKLRICRPAIPRRLDRDFALWRNIRSISAHYPLAAPLAIWGQQQTPNLLQVCPLAWPLYLQADPGTDLGDMNAPDAP